MGDITEKRVYDAAGPETPAFVVGEFGVVRVDVSGDLVGGFGLVRRCSARDAAGRDGRVAVATDEDVLSGGPGGFEELGVGPATAVGLADDAVVVAREDGAVVRVDGDGRTELGHCDDVRAVDGDLLAAWSGVYRVVGEDLRPAGLDAARDVSAAGTPLAATDDGLYGLANGWVEAASGPFRAVSADPSTRSPGRAHAAGDAGLLARADGSWRRVELPVEGTVVALDHAEAAYAVTREGTLLASVGDGWRHRHLGLDGVRGIAAP